MFLLSMLHPFSGHLRDWEQGVPVACGTPWTREVIDMAIDRGPHPTACLPEAIALVHEDVEYQVAAGFTQIVLWDEIKHNLSANFKISPVAVIPQPNRRGRIILDLSFPVRRQNSGKRQRRMGEVVQQLVNETPERLAPPEGVKAIGQVLPKLFQFMADTPANKVIGFSKIDLSHGFGRMIVEEDQKRNFCYAMLDPPGAPRRIVVPWSARALLISVPQPKQDATSPSISSTTSSTSPHIHWKTMSSPTRSMISPHHKGMKSTGL
jgi:hypothetical protein